MRQRPAPETDQFKVKLKTTCGEKYWVPVEHSERLERECDEAREALSEIALYLSVGMGDETTTAQQYKQRILEGIKMLSEPIVNLWKQAEKERDEARELNAKLIALAERATDDLRWFYESHADGISLELEKLKEAAK